MFSVAWRPDGKRLASGGKDKTVRIWEWVEGEPMTQFAALAGHSEDVLAVAWSPDGKRLASAGKDQSVRVWDADSRGSGPVLRGHKGSVYSVEWNRDGSLPKLFQKPFARILWRHRHSENRRSKLSIPPRWPGGSLAGLQGNPSPRARVEPALVIYVFASECLLACSITRSLSLCIPR